MNDVRDPARPAAPAAWGPLAPSRAVVAGILLLALGLAFLAQSYLTRRIMPDTALVLYALAVALFGVAIWPVPALRAALVPPRPAVMLRRWQWSAALAVALAGATFLSAGGNTLRPLTLVLWAGAIVATAYTAGVRPDVGAWGAALRAWWRQPPAGLTLRVPWVAVLLAGVLAVSAFFHFSHLDTVPSEPTSDHAEKFLDIQDLVDGLRPWYFPRNTGREPLQFYVALAVASVRGVDFITLKVASAIAGTLVALGCFLFARQFFGDGVGLLAGFFAAIGKWEVITGRFGLRVPYAPLCAALTLYALFRALRSGARRDYLWLGLALGAGLYSYTPYRLVVPLFVTVALGLTFLLRWRDGRAVRLDLIRHALWCYVMAGIVALPLLRLMVDYPALFWGRALSRLEPADSTVGHPLVVFLGNLKNAALMFNWQGDIVAANSVSLDPFLDPVTGALFVLGVTYAAARLVWAREWVYAYLLLGLPILTLSSTLAVGWPAENPSVFRASPAIPVVYLFAALPLALAARHLRRALGGAPGTVLAAGLVAGALLIAARLNYETIFVTYAQQYNGMVQHTQRMGEVVRDFATSIGSYATAYHVPWPHWVDTRNVGVAAGNPRWENVLLSPAAVRTAAAGPTPQLYLVNVNDAATLALLREVRPEGYATIRRAAIPGKEFLVYFVPDAASGLR